MSLSDETMNAVKKYARATGRRYHLPEEEIEDLEQHGLMHAFVAITQKYDPTRGDDPQKFARIRASIEIKRQAAKKSAPYYRKNKTNQEIES